VPDYAALDPLVFHIAFVTTDVHRMLNVCSPPEPAAPER